jgi:hypothetical protein
VVWAHERFDFFGGGIRLSARSEFFRQGEQECGALTVAVLVSEADIADQLYNLFKAHALHAQGSAMCCLRQEQSGPILGFLFVAS